MPVHLILAIIPHAGAGALTSGHEEKVSLCLECRSTRCRLLVVRRAKKTFASLAWNANAFSPFEIGQAC